MEDLAISSRKIREDIREIFEKQQRYHPDAAKATVKERIRLLSSLEKAILEWRPRIHQALADDFQKPPQEVDLVDIYYVLREIRHARSHLRKWMRPVYVPVPLAFMGSRAYYIHEPKGVCLIISPWNYPLNLTLGPLVSALAAGCTAIVKPSESTPHASKVMKHLLESLFPSELVAVVEGDAEESQQLLELPFHHIFFTGSTLVGKIVMAAAAKSLASVTLELGGKCPAVVDVSANIRAAAHRIIHTKFVNAGQTCIAPDYVLVHAHVYEQLLSTLTEKLRAFYPDTTPAYQDYSGVVHEVHLRKMQGYVSDAVAQGAHVVAGGGAIDDALKFQPTILRDVPLTSRIMEEEIFGPILPVIKYQHTDEAIALMQKMDRPLGLYVFGRGEVVNTIIRNTRAGGSCVNHCALNYYNPYLPFGGVNQSGFGKSHGYAGFQAFSNIRSVFKQVWPYSPLDWLHAPYTKAKQRLINFTLKWM